MLHKAAPEFAVVPTGTITRHAVAKTVGNIDQTRPSQHIARMVGPDRMRVTQQG
jgi:hypothetical protein